MSLHSGMISLVVPAFNEEENLPVLIHRLMAVMNRYDSYEILIVDDGSSDQTRYVLRQLSQEYPVVRFISFSRNLVIKWPFGRGMTMRLEMLLFASMLTFSTPRTHSNVD